MSEINSKLKEENENTKEIFDFNGDKSKLNHLKELFTDLVKNSENGPDYFVDFLVYYSKCRPYQHTVSKILIECVYSCFPEQINEIQQEIKNTNFLKFVLFPEEFPINESEEQKEMFSFLQKDDIDGFISFLSNNPTIDIKEEQKLKRGGYYFFLVGWFVISLIDFCCLFGSLKCFKYLLLNKCEITENTLNYSIAGGNQEIINILK